MSTLHPNELVIQKFYEAFHARDAAGMTACYDPNVIFSDPAFGVLEGGKAIAMWHMLCERAKDLQGQSATSKRLMEPGLLIGRQGIFSGPTVAPFITWSRQRSIFATERSSSTQTLSICGGGRVWRWEG